MKRQTGINQGASYDKNSHRANRTHVPLIMVGEINIFNPTYTPKEKQNTSPKDLKNIKSVYNKKRSSPYWETDNKSPSSRGLLPQTPLNLSQFNFNKRHHSIENSSRSPLKDHTSSIGGLFLPIDSSYMPKRKGSTNSSTINSSWTQERQKDPTLTVNSLFKTPELCITT